MNSLPPASKKLDALADPRPVIIQAGQHHLLDGRSCQACDHAIALQLPLCPRCRGAVEPAQFGPRGVIWALTVVHVPARPDDKVPYTLAYVDLDQGPRLLAYVAPTDATVEVGSSVALTALSALGDPTVEVAP
ncbi:MAG: OB-fold domain-containing protein [Actinomycetota bacterium]